MFFIKKKLTLDKSLSSLLSLFLFLLPWQTIWIYKEQFLNGEKWQYGTLGFYATEVLLWVCVGLFIVWYWRKAKLRIKNVKFKLTRDRIFILSCLLVVLYSFVSILWSPDKGVALLRALRMVEMYWLFFMLFLGPLKLRGFVVSFVFGAALQSILGTWQFLNQSTFASKWVGMVSHPTWQPGTSIIQGIGTGRWLRAYGAFPHPNIYGGYLVIALLFTLVWICLEKKPGLKIRLPQFLVFILILNGLFFSFSRSAWLALILALLFYIPLFIFFRKICKSCPFIFSYSSGFYYLVHIGVGVLLILILTLIYFPLIKTRLFAGAPHEVRSVEERVGGYGEAWQLFKQGPWLGTGVGNYTVAVYNQNSIMAGYEYQPVHNSYFLVLVEFGLVGFLLVVGSVAMWFYMEAGRLKKRLVFVLALLSSGFVLMMFDHYIVSGYIGIMMYAVWWGAIARFSSVCTQIVHQSST